ncbi:hypothetical protein GF420_09675 [candidate division GN15 bacterium]|nr:hypothetical protein [candidate division GN15 bacterium]
MDPLSRAVRSALIGALVILIATVTADAETFTPNEHPSLDIPRAVGKIEIDGVADETAWQRAAVADNFCETRPGDQTEPPARSEVRITYDDTHLYLLFKAYDDPATVRATMSDRDNIFSDDYFGIIFDTYGDKAWAYELFVNPFGIQGDLRWTPDGEDGSFDIVWASEGRITDWGWQVEVAVPFSSLRFPNRDEQVWTATFWRDHPRDSRRKYSWAAIDRDNSCWLCNFGTLTGIRNVRPGGRLNVLPSVLAFQSGRVSDFDDPGAGFDNSDPDAELSLNAKYSIASDLTAEAAVNPDFSQVESDEAQIDVNTTTALFFPERRPFFQEGSDLFSTWLDVTYTRSITDPEVAGKVYGRLGRTSVAYVLASDRSTAMLVPFAERTRLVPMGGAISNIMRVRQTLMSDSYVGATLTDRRYDGGGAGTVFSGDGRIRLHDNYSLEFQGAVSRTAEPDDRELSSDINGLTFDGGRRTADFDGETFAGHAVYASLERGARFWEFDVDYWEYSPRFRADNGFVVQNDYRLVNAWTGLFFRYGTGLVELISPRIEAGRKWNFAQEFKDEWLRPELAIDLKAQTYLYFSTLFSNEEFKDSLITGITNYAIRVDSRFSKPVSLGARYGFGRQIARRTAEPVLGDEKRLSMWGRIRPTDRLTIEPELQWLRLDMPDDLDPSLFVDETVTPGQNISTILVTRTRFNYQFTRRLFVRLIVEYYDEDNEYDPSRSIRELVVEPLLTYKVNPYTVFYLGSTHDYSDFDYSGVNQLRRRSQQFFAKLQYLFRT